jgi:hypothetical protein
MANRYLSVLTLLAVASPGVASTIDQVNVSDDIYGSFSGTINSGATGAAATLYWDSAVTGAIFTIDFTNSSNMITDVLFSDAGHDSPIYAGDSLEFDGFQSSNSAIGTSCTASATTACLVATGAFQDVTALIGTVTGGVGDSGDISILAGDAVSTPEPGSLFLLIGGLGAGWATLRKHRCARAFPPHAT